MARRASRKRINDLLAPYGTLIQDAFNASIADITSQADFDRIVKALTAGNIDAALDGLHINEAAFFQFKDALQQTYQAGGAQAVSLLPTLKAADGSLLVIRFVGNQGAAQEYLEQYSGTLIRGLTLDQLNMARDVMSAGLGAGKGPREIGLDLVGRIGKNGVRQGGSIGISQYQATLVQNVRDELAGADPTALRNYLSRQLRDQRFDSRVRAALNDPAKTIPADIQQAMATSYQNRLLAFRGEQIGQTEAMRALHAGQHAAYQQAVLQGTLNGQTISRVWRTAQDKNVRDTHADMEGQTVGLEEPFVTGGGEQLMYPGDPSGSAAETIGCRCDVEVRIDFLSNIR